MTDFAISMLQTILGGVVMEIKAVRKDGTPDLLASLGDMEARRASLLRAISILEQADKPATAKYLAWRDEALNSGDGVYRP
jgi:hypothetical protein